MKNNIFKVLILLILIADTTYAKSKKHLDSATFQEIDSLYSKDKNGVYINGSRKKIEDLDPYTFQVLNNYVKDKNGIYIVENDGNLVSVNDEEVDWKSFVRLVIGTNIYQDKNNMYFIKNHKLEKIENAPEVDEYNLYIYNDRYINKYSTVYYLDTDNGTFKKVIKAKLNDFRVLDEEYAKGKTDVYFRGQILKEADYSSFDIKYNEQIEVYEIRDKNKVYKIVRK